MKTLPAALTTAIQSAATTPRVLVELLLDTPVRVGTQGITAYGRTFVEASVKASVSGNGATIQIFNESGTLGSQVISQGIAGKRARVWLYYVDRADDFGAINLLTGTSDFVSGWSWFGGISATPTISTAIGYTTLGLTSGWGEDQIYRYQNVTIPASTSPYTFQVEVKKGSSVGYDGFADPSSGVQLLTPAPTPTRSGPTLQVHPNTGAASGTGSIIDNGDTYIMSVTLNNSSDTSAQVRVFPALNGIGKGESKFRNPKLYRGSPITAGYDVVFDGEISSATVGEYVVFNCSRFGPRKCPNLFITAADFPDLDTVGTLDGEI